MRAVLDPNVIISALLTPSGAPAEVLRAWLAGKFDLIVSPLLLIELGRALAYPKLRRRIDPLDAIRVIGWLATSAIMAEDPGDSPTVRSRDPGDDYLIALAQNERAAIVSGDAHLLNLEGVPTFSAADFLDLLQGPRG